MTAKAILAEAMTRYPPRLPKAVPEGKKLVHNSVLPSRRQGERGSRYLAGGRRRRQSDRLRLRMGARIGDALSRRPSDRLTRQL